ncbi:MAG: hypothetical protein ACOZE7_04455 [Pseudomonadota bacterium]
MLKKPNLIVVMMLHCTLETVFGVVMLAIGIMSIDASQAPVPQQVDTVSSLYGMPLGCLAVFMGAGLLLFAVSKAKSLRG